MQRSVESIVSSACAIKSKITQLSQLDLNAIYCYADYLTWQLDKTIETIELIKGKISLMNTAPSCITKGFQSA